MGFQIEDIAPKRQVATCSPCYGQSTKKGTKLHNGAALSWKIKAPETTVCEPPSAWELMGG